jgi:hypothetical protein
LLQALGYTLVAKPWDRASASTKAGDSSLFEESGRSSGYFSALFFADVYILFSNVLV